MPRDSLARLVTSVDRERAGRFSGSVPGRSTEARKVCISCRTPAGWRVRRFDQDEREVCTACGGELVEVEGW